MQQSYPFSPLEELVIANLTEGYCEVCVALVIINVNRRNNGVPSSNRGSIFLAGWWYILAPLIHFHRNFEARMKYPRYLSFIVRTCVCPGLVIGWNLLPNNTEQYVLFLVHSCAQAQAGIEIHIEESLNKHRLGRMCNL